MRSVGRPVASSVYDNGNSLIFNKISHIFEILNPALVNFFDFLQFFWGVGVLPIKTAPKSSVYDIGNPLIFYIYIPIIFQTLMGVLQVRRCRR